MLSAPWHAPHYITAVCVLHAQMQQYHKQSYELKQQFLILVDYYNKSERKLARSIIEEIIQTQP